MDSRDRLIALRDRVGKLTGADREVDGAVFKLLGGFMWEQAMIRAKMHGLGLVNPDAVDRNAQDYAPRFTDSVDAVLSLIGRVLPGYGWRAGDSPAVWAAIGAPHPAGPFYDETCRSWRERGATPALALLHALLSASHPETPPMADTGERDGHLTGAQRFRQVRAKVRIVADRNLRKFLADEIDMLPGSLDYEREQIIRELDRAFDAGVQHGRSTVGLRIGRVEE